MATFCRCGQKWHVTHTAQRCPRNFTDGEDIGTNLLLGGVRWLLYIEFKATGVS